MMSTRNDHHRSLNFTSLHKHTFFLSIESSHRKGITFPAARARFQREGRQAARVT